MRPDAFKQKGVRLGAHRPVQQSGDVRQALTIACMAVVLTAACARTAQPILMSPPEFVKSEPTTVGPIEIPLEPKVDIVFVMDNSDSMLVNQKNVAKNIYSLVDSLGESVDLRAGVISVFDKEKIRVPLDANNIFDEASAITLAKELQRVKKITPSPTGTQSSGRNSKPARALGV